MHSHDRRMQQTSTFLQNSATEEDIEVTVDNQRERTSSSSSRRKHNNHARKPMGFANNNDRKKKQGKYRSKNNMNKAKMKDHTSTNTRAKTYKEIKEVRKAKQMTVESVKDANTARTSTVTGVSSTTNTKTNANANDNDNAQSTSNRTTRKSTSTSPSQEQQQQQQQHSEQKDQPQDNFHNVNVKQRIHNMNTIRSSRTFEEQKRSSERLNKARVLLKDLTDPDVARTSAGVGVDVNVGAGIGFDGKGNLQRGNGDFVTRWAEGVKVAEPLRKYDPVSTEKLLFRQPAKWLVRNVQIGFPLATWAIAVASDVILKNEEQNRRSRAKRLLEIISGLGPAIIKGGQALASRSDLMPSEYLDQLQKLQDDVPRFDNGLALSTVEEELGMDFDDVFELVEKEPIAAASIGQVYKARLRKNGDLVALKIQRPKCEEIIALDLYVLRWWSGVANVLLKLLNRDINVQSIIDDFGELIYRELDYVAEAANAQRFSELYAGQVKDVFVPKVYSELTTSKVLTMEWVEGFRLTDSDKLTEYGLDSKKLVDTLVQCSLRQILGNGELQCLIAT
jgi:hypothetical protein